jgi:hypothetical protein
MGSVRTHATRRPVRHLAALTVAALVLVGAGCGDDDDDSGKAAATSLPSAAQPAPGESTFEQGNFDTLPRYPAGRPVSDRNDQGNVSVQSYMVTSVSPGQILDWYASHLSGWTQDGPVQQIGPNAYRGQWQRAGDKLLVSSAPAPGLEQNSSEVTSQYSLTLTRTG